jgi:hypothetical protein
MERQKVMIAIPTANSIHHSVVGVLCQILLQGKHDIITYISAMRGIGEHRNVIVEEFLKTDAQWLLMIDSDNPPPKNVLDLMEEDKDVIGCPTPINLNWMQGINNFYWNVFDDAKPRKEEGEGLEKVDAIGTGCILIRRSVLEKIKTPFTTVRDKTDKRIVGTDLAFCERCAGENIDVYAHWFFTCKHYKEMELSSVKNMIL